MCTERQFYILNSNNLFKACIQAVCSFDNSIFWNTLLVSVLFTCLFDSNHLHTPITISQFCSRLSSLLRELIKCSWDHTLSPFFLESFCAWKGLTYLTLNSFKTFNRIMTAILRNSPLLYQMLKLLYLICRHHFKVNLARYHGTWELCNLTYWL